MNDLRAEIDHHIAAGRMIEAHALLGRLWRESPSTSTAGFVTARFEQARAQLAVTTCRVAFLRSFTVEPAVTLLQAAAAVNNIFVVPRVGDFNVYMQEALSPSSALYEFAPEVIVLALQTRDVAPELWSRFADLSPDEIERGITRAVDGFRSFVDAVRAHSNAHLVLHNLELPSLPSQGLLDGRDGNGQKDAIARINRELAALARARSGVYLLDYDGLVARHGRIAWHDEAKWLAMRMPIAAPCLIHLANEWLRYLHPLSGRVCKVLVTDLDNTLWGGVIGEDGIEGIAVGVEHPGAAFRELQRALLDLHRRGILLAVASKNNPAEAREAIERHPEMLLRAEQFAAMRIGWGDKAQALREIAAELRVGLDALAFLDDNPTERQWVRSQLPEVSVIELPASPAHYARAVRDCPLFERLALSQEDRERSGYYAADRARDELQKGVATVEEFYRSLEMEAEIAPVDGETAARVAQLTQKTNQFNVTTRRYSQQEIEQLAADPACRVWWMRVRDRFGDHGVVGVAITRRAARTCELDTFLLSCRVIGRTVEDALLATVAERARGDGAEQLAGWFLPTAKNAPAKQFYATHGFTLVEEKEAASRWSLDLSRQRVDVPAWIRSKVRSEEDPR